MKHFVIGTAGHIDHGKTLLTKALTGVDTDRLAEEKKRGITIELGFAALQLGEYSVSIVDVPGHEKFVKTMMAGSGGMDAAMLVVAADDGVMPQTREHLDILQLLQIKNGLVVLTKCDLADASRQQATIRQLARLTQGTFLENAPIVCVSAKTGEGIGELKAALLALCEKLPEGCADAPFRMAIDRAFPLPGFGSIAAGSITEGTVGENMQVELFPEGLRGTVRTMQSHGEEVRSASAGMRAALSFSGQIRDGISRGGTLAQPDSMLVTQMLDVQLQITGDCPYKIRNASTLHFFHGASQTVCTLRLLDADSLSAGQRGFAQLKLQTPVAVRYGDRFVLRFFSPVVTVGGGSILAGTSARLRRRDENVLRRFERLCGGDAVLTHITDNGLCPTEPERLRLLCNLPTERFYSQLPKDKLIELPNRRCISAECAGVRLKTITDALRQFHTDYPFQRGMRSAELYSRFFPERECPSAELLQYYVNNNSLSVEDDFVFLPDFAPVLTREFIIMRRKLQHYYKEQGFAAPDKNAVFEKFAARGPVLQQAMDDLRISGGLVFLTPRYAVHPACFEDALCLFRGLFEENTEVSLVQFKQAAGISRKYAQLFLEYFDRRGISRRVGDLRILLKK